MKRPHPSAVAVLILTAALTGLIFSGGCDISSGDEVVRNPGVDIAGAYRNDGGIPDRQSGSRTTALNITQSGNQLFAVDNHGLRWTGRIVGSSSASAASIQLTGRTTASREVRLNGDIRISGETATLGGLWLEPGLTAAISAQASVRPAPSPSPTPNPSPTPTPNGGTNLVVN